MVPSTECVPSCLSRYPEDTTVTSIRRMQRRSKLLSASLVTLVRYQAYQDPKLGWKRLFHHIISKAFDVVGQKLEFTFNLTHCSSFGSRFSFPARISPQTHPPTPCCFANRPNLTGRREYEACKTFVKPSSRPAMEQPRSRHRIELLYVAASLGPYTLKHIPTDLL